MKERRHPAGWLDGILPSDRGAAGCRPTSRLEGGAPTARKDWIIGSPSGIIPNQFRIIPIRFWIITSHSWTIQDRSCILASRFCILAHQFWIIAVQLRIIAMIQNCTPMQFWIIPMIQNAPRCILNHLDTIWRTLEDVRSVQFLVTSRIATVQNRIGSLISTFESRPETFSRVRGRISSIQNCTAMIQNCIGMIRRITGVIQNEPRCISNHRGGPECTAVVVKEVNRALFAYCGETQDLIGVRSTTETLRSRRELVEEALRALCVSVVRVTLRYRTDVPTAETLRSRRKPFFQSPLDREDSSKNCLSPCPQCLCGELSSFGCGCAALYY